MSDLKSLYKSILYSFFISPLFYVSALITILFCSFKFFFISKFFIAGIGSSDLRPFFNSIPYISIITIPLLTLRCRYFILDESLPFYPFKKFSVTSLAILTVFALPLFLMTAIPLCVSNFGDIEILQCLMAFLGIFLHALLSIIFTILFFSIFSSYTALPLIFSSFFLALLNFIHLLPLYIKTPSFLAFISRTFSFAWHFDSFSKGILDTRNLFYYLIFSFVILVLACHYEYTRLGKKTGKITIILFTAIFTLLSLSSGNLYLRIDLTKNRQFTLSPSSKNLLKSLDGELRITYFRSSELKDYYPQTSDVVEFLSDYAGENKNISLTLEKADPQKLNSLGLQSQQIKRENGTKTEFISVYSSILLQYLEKSTVIPFVISTQNLEYDLTQKVSQILTEKERKVYILCGNGRQIEESYMYVAPWLNSRGFSSEILNEFNANEVLRNLSPEDELLLLGTKDLSLETSFLIQNAVEKGTKLFVATSPFHTSIEGEWKITKAENDTFISYLNGKGFAFDNTLAEDISCYPLMMASGEGNDAEYARINYPLWIVLQNQENARQGMTLFWPSPLTLYNDVKALLFTSEYAWKQKSSMADDGSLFLTNPFLLPKTAAQSDSKNQKCILAARKDNISLIADQFFVSSLLTRFISGDSTGDFRNYDYLTKELLILRGENELASLMEKSLPSTSLYKIVDEDKFNFERKKTIAIIFILLPLIIMAIFAGMKIKRR